jgi:hypothetical protein
MKHCIILLIAIAFVTMTMYADEGRTGQAGFQFLKVPIGARQIALGNGGSTLASGAGAIYWNPAGVASQSNYEFQFSNVSWFGDVSCQYFSAAAGIGDWGTLGFAVQYLGYPDIIETTEEAPDGTGATFKPYDLGLSVNYSRQMTEKVSFGLNVKYLNETIGLVTAEALAFDAGLIYKTGYSGLQFGFAIMNYGTKGHFTGTGLRRFYYRPDAPSIQTPVPILFEADYFELPSSVQGGISFEPFKTENVSTTLCADYIVNTFSRDRQNLGFEVGYDDMIFLRGGYIFQTDYNATTKGNGNFGIGLKYGFRNNIKLSFDYAYADLGILDNAQYITFGIQF